MDPDLLWAEIRGNILYLRSGASDGDSETRTATVQGLRDLADWLEKGGFAPSNEP